MTSALTRGRRLADNARGVAVAESAQERVDLPLRPKQRIRGAIQKLAPSIVSPGRCMGRSGLLMGAGCVWVVPGGENVDGSVGEGVRVRGGEGVGG